MLEDMKHLITTSMKIGVLQSLIDEQKMNRTSPEDDVFIDRLMDTLIEVEAEYEEELKKMPPLLDTDTCKHCLGSGVYLVTK